MELKLYVEFWQYVDDELDEDVTLTLGLSGCSDDLAVSVPVLDFLNCVFGGVNGYGLHTKLLDEGLDLVEVWSNSIDGYEYAIDVAGELYTTDSYWGDMDSILQVNSGVVHIVFTDECTGVFGLGALVRGAGVRYDFRGLSKYDVGFIKAVLLWVSHKTEVDGVYYVTADFLNACLMYMARDGRDSMSRADFLDGFVVLCMNAKMTGVWVDGMLSDGVLNELDDWVRSRLGSCGLL